MSLKPFWQPWCSQQWLSPWFSLPLDVSLWLQPVLPLLGYQSELRFASAFMSKAKQVKWSHWNESLCWVKGTNQMCIIKTLIADMEQSRASRSPFGLAVTVPGLGQGGAAHHFILTLFLAAPFLSPAPNLTTFLVLHCFPAWAVREILGMVCQVWGQ